MLWVMKDFVRVAIAGRADSIPYQIRTCPLTKPEQVKII